MKSVSAQEKQLFYKGWWCRCMFALKKETVVSSVGFRVDLVKMISNNTICGTNTTVKSFLANPSLWIPYSFQQLLSTVAAFLLEIFLEEEGCCCCCCSCSCCCTWLGEPGGASAAWPTVMELLEALVDISDVLLSLPSCATSLAYFSSTCRGQHSFKNMRV